MCTNPRDRLPVAVLFAAIAVVHAVGVGSLLSFVAPYHLRLTSFDLTIVWLFVVTWLCAIAFAGSAAVTGAGRWRASGVT